MGNQDPVVDTNEDFSKMKVVELKKLLKDRGLAVAGTKDELIERLKQANEAAEKTLLEDASEETAGDTTAATIDEELENEIMNEENKGAVVKPGEKRKTAENGNTVVTPSAEKTDENKENSTGDESKLVEGKDQNDEPVKKIIKLSTITPEEKRELRAKKFGLTEEEKKEARAKRFGITPQTKTAPSKPAITTVKNLVLTTLKKDDALLKKRAERFGLQATKKLTPEEEEKRKKRAERFGISPPQTETIKK